MPQTIILASQSPQRFSLFSTLGIPFEVRPANLDEKAIVADSLEQRAEKIAKAKAELISSQHPEAIIVAADTYLIKDGVAFEKPESVEEAKQMLHQFSSKTVYEVTGVCYLDPVHDIRHTVVEQVEVTFRELSSVEIERYAKTQPVTTWSAAFCPAYPEGAALIARINGSFTGFTHGLPVEVVVSCLRKSSVAV